MQATLVLWRIVPTSEWHYGMHIYSPQLLVDLLLEIFSTTEQMPEDVETQSFWRVCREEHGLPSDPNRSQSPCPSHAPCGQGQCSQRDLAFARHTGLQRRP